MVELRSAVEPSDEASRTDPCPLALVVVASKGQVLFGLNRWRREWELPGGLIEDGETARVTACRELCEETGVALTPDRLIWVGCSVFELLNPDRRELGAVFVAELTQPPNLESSDELIEVAWCALDNPPASHSPLDLAIARWSVDFLASCRA